MYTRTLCGVGVPTAAVEVLPVLLIRLAFY